jgi:DNA-binding NarL/FixJ family response regulator
MDREPAMSQNLARASVLIVEHRSAIASTIASALARVQDVDLLGCIPRASDRNALSPGPAPRVVICGTGILLPQTLTQFSELRATWPQAQLIALSFDPNAESRALALSSGADDYVSGLNLSQELQAAVQRALGRPTSSGS